MYTCVSARACVCMPNVHFNKYDIEFTVARFGKIMT